MKISGPIFLFCFSFGFFFTELFPFLLLRHLMTDGGYLLKQFYTVQFETLQAFLSQSEDVYVLLALLSI